MGETIGDKDLAKIARDYVTDWEPLAPFLGLSCPQREEIRRSNPTKYGMQKQECLEVWREMKGNEATYLALIKASEEAKAQKMADSVKTLTMQPNITPSLSQGIYIIYIADVQ